MYGDISHGDEASRQEGGKIVRGVMVSTNLVPSVPVRNNFEIMLLSFMFYKYDESINFFWLEFFFACISNGTSQYNYSHKS